ncbi:MAG: AAA family ATPase, partial [Clostridia bacterium]|nr:AAA family ATPase [Clostridia bacterium]
FGKLKNVCVTAEKGINILSAPNESGKSTLAAFIKFVFYGFAGARMQTLTENERKLYTPWDAEVSEGSITITADGTKYTVHRRCLASGKESAEITNYSTGRAEFTGEVAGEVFFGVSEEVFARTLFFRQLTLPQSRDEILADRLKNIAISADEQVSTKKAISKLNECKNELKGRLGNGLIPKAEKERDLLEEQITEALSVRKETERLSGEIKKRAQDMADAAEQLEILQKERRNIEKYESLTKLRNINRLTLEERNAREEYEAVSAGLKQRDDGAAMSALFAKNTEYVAICRECEKNAFALEEAKREHEELIASAKIAPDDAKKASKLLKSSKKTSKLLFIIGALLVVFGIVSSLASENTMGLGIIIGVAGLFSAVFGAVIMAKPSGFARELGFATASEMESAIEVLPMLERQISESGRRLASIEDEYNESATRMAILKRELDEGIGRYTDVAEGNYGEKLERILRLSTESGEKLAVWRAKKEELDNALKGVDINALAEDARGAEPPERDRAKVDYEIRFYSEKHYKLSELNRESELNLATLEAKCGDPAVLVGKRDSLNARIAELEMKHKAYETAIKTIEDAADYMKSMVAPRIGERADEYFTAATGGKYSAFEIDTRLSMSFGEDMRRSCDYLSAGTRDSAYLSLRLALADMLFGGCGVPILLDDAFVRMDDNRLRMMLGAVKEAAKKHQIFILTHGNREALAFSDIGADYSEIQIKQV